MEAELTDTPRRPIGDTNLAGAMLRLVSIGAKFGLTIYLARYLSTADLGVYGLVTATISIGMQLVGLEYHHFATREVVRATRERRVLVVGSQLRVYAASYAVAACALALACSLGWISRSTAAWLCALIVGNHLGQEVHRLLVALSRPREAYWVLAIGQGLWVFPAVAAGLLWPSLRNLPIVLGTWIVFTLFGLVVGLWLLRQEGLLQRSRSAAVSSIIRQGLPVGALFLISSVSFQLVDYSGRYFLNGYREASQVGVYTLFSSMASALRDLLFAALITIVSPQMVAAAKAGDYALLRKLSAGLQRRCTGWTAALIPPFILVGYAASRLSGRAEIGRGFKAYLLLLAATLVTNYSMGAHYTLYALRADRQLMYTHVGAAAVCLGLQAWLTASWGASGAATATLASFTSMAIAKGWLASRMLQGHIREARDG
jgi:O-antigen/teichoic acid export membrane protein